jgi:hypothetical protein
VTCEQAHEAMGVALLTRTAMPAEVEAHLASCPSCRAERDELAALPRLLALAGPDPFDATAADPHDIVPDDLTLQRLLREVRRRRQRVRLAIGAAAAAGLVLVGIPVAMLATRPTTTSSASIERTATDPATGVSAAAAIKPSTEGSDLSMSVEGVPPGTWCTIQVVAKDGSWHKAASWQAEYNGSGQVTGSVPVPPAQIQRIEVRDDNGRLLLPMPLA